MRSIATLGLLALASVLPAQTGSVSVLHGIPGLGKAVDVCANGGKLFSFDYGDFKGPLALAPATYKLEVKLDDKVVLSADAKVEAGKNYTVVAHLKEKEGIALSVFVNNTSKISRWGNARLHVRHTAMAPAVDVVAKRWWITKTLFSGVSNGQGGDVEVYNGTYDVSLNAAGTKTRAFGPASLSLKRGENYSVFAIGELGKSSFRLFVQTIKDAVSTPELTGMVRGTSCLGKIGISKMAPKFDESFDITLTGGPKGGSGLFHMGRSDSRFLFFKLPLHLSFFGKGCNLYQSTEVIMPVKFDANGNAKVSQSIRTEWAKWFMEVHYQFSAATNSGLGLSDYASVETK